MTMKRKWSRCMCREGRKIRDAVRAPVIRHSIHCRCGLFKRAHGHDPLWAMKFDHDCTVPLIRVIAIVGAIMLTVGAVSSMLSALSPMHRD